MDSCRSVGRTARFEPATAIPGRPDMVRASPPAGRADTEDGEVTGVDGEPVLGRDPAHRTLDDLCRHLLDASALPADEVEVVRVVGGVVGRRAVAEMGVGDEAELLEQLERAIDGRDVDAAGGAAYPLGDLVGGGVAERGDGLEDELALRGEPVAARAEAGLPGF